MKILLIIILATTSCIKTYPSISPKKAHLLNKNNTFTLQNNLIKGVWNFDNNKFNSYSIKNKLTKETFNSNQKLFAIASKPQVQDPNYTFIAIRKKNTELQAVISNDAKNWDILASFPIKQFPTELKAIRIGKTSITGDAKDYQIAGEMGVCKLQQIKISNNKGQVIDITANPNKIYKSLRKGTTLKITNEQITINSQANNAVFAEYSTTPNWNMISCKVKKATDKGLSWGPGITLIFNDGKYLLLNIRSQGQFTVANKEGEQIIDKKPLPPLQCDLSSNAFTLLLPVKQTKIKNGKSIQATFTHSPTGINIHWQAILLNGSNYIRQTYTLTNSNKPFTFYGLEFINGNIKNAKQIGTVLGSPVATNSLFFGIEMPFTANYFNPTGFCSGFPCNLPIKKGDEYNFTTVIGVYKKNQLRRSFNYYLERERATPSHQFLHYNCWYDLGLNPNQKTFTKVITEYHQQLTKKRGVTIDSFVMDDGWDNFNTGLWEFNRKKFPHGFEEVSKATRKIKSNLGVWISPLGGYSGANQRTVHAKKMGLIENNLDLSQPKYYNWFYKKCLNFMKNYGVNYYKWDKAGSGVSPHFMALIRCAKELKKYNPNLFINVTVGTWPSPFWLNHIDCTWRTGTGDVAWMGVGDNRERWLTFRDWGCYQKFVKPAPLYPLNSVMHHGLVLGRYFQAKKVSQAGANFKHAARSYFGTGANLHELYLTPKMMTPKAWDEVAEAAKWAKKNQKILIDSHWVGGNPSKLNIYGWASWSPKKSIITLRNPSNKLNQLTIDLTKALEIPTGYSQYFKVKNAYKDQTFSKKTLSGKYNFKLKPFQVLCLELYPIK